MNRLRAAHPQDPSLTLLMNLCDANVGTRSSASLQVHHRSIGPWLLTGF
jgi:hypothetical protein